MNSLPILENLIPDQNWLIKYRRNDLVHLRGVSFKQATAPQIFAACVPFNSFMPSDFEVLAQAIGVHEYLSSYIKVRVFLRDRANRPLGWGSLASGLECENIEELADQVPADADIRSAIACMSFWTTPAGTRMSYPLLAGMAVRDLMHYASARFEQGLGTAPMRAERAAEIIRVNDRRQHLPAHMLLRMLERRGISADFFLSHLSIASRREFMAEAVGI